MRHTDFPDSYQITRNFKYGEFRCPHCGGNHIQVRFVEKLQEARDYSNELGPGTSYRINSGWRCQVHNEEVGGTRKSPHMDGLAADIAVSNNYRRMCIVYGLIKAGFTRLGVYRKFIHADMRDSRVTTTMWVE